MHLLVVNNYMIILIHEIHASFLVLCNFSTFCLFNVVVGVHSILLYYAIQIKLLCVNVVRYIHLNYYSQYSDIKLYDVSLHILSFLLNSIHRKLNYLLLCILTLDFTAFMKAIQDSL